MLCMALLLCWNMSAAQPSPVQAERAGMDRRVREATAVRDKHWRRLSKLPAVVGSGIGLSKKEPGKIAIQILVSRELTDKEKRKFPSSLEGVPVEVIVTGVIRALPRDASAKSGRQSPHGKEAGKNP